MTALQLESCVSTLLATSSTILSWMAAMSASSSNSSRWLQLSKCCGKDWRGHGRHLDVGLGVEVGELEPVELVLLLHGDGPAGAGWHVLVVRVSLLPPTWPGLITGPESLLGSPWCLEGGGWSLGQGREGQRWV